MTAIGYIKFLCDEIGLVTLLSAGMDTYIIILLRMIRLVGFGATALILVLYLREIGINEEFIGFIMTLTFVGDLVTSFLLSLMADKLGRRWVLLFSSACMTLTGLSFCWFTNPYLISIVCVLGIITPSGGEVGPFRSVEQSSIASLTLPEQRPDIYAWYTFLGTFCAALGSFACGLMVDYANLKLGYSLAESYRFVFAAYTVLSFITFALSYLISAKVEWKHEVQPEDNGNQETSQLLPEEVSTPVEEEVKKSWFNFLPTLHKSTYSIVLKLSILFALDAFASSLVPGSWQSYYLKSKFNASASYLGSVFFVTGIVSGFMSLLSTPMTKRCGAVVTMVGTHLPASILLALVPIPNTLKVTMAILVIRASTQSMDVAPKHVFLAALVPSSERTAVFGFVNVIKTLAQVIGPTIVGIFTKHDIQWVTFTIAGCLKAIYDIGMLVTFLAFNRHKQH